MERHWPALREQRVKEKGPAAAPFDLAVISGGIACDAAGRRVSVYLSEIDDLAGGNLVAIGRADLRRTAPSRTLGNTTISASSGVAAENAGGVARAPPYRAAAAYWGARLP